MASQYKQAKSLHSDLPFAILFIMFLLAVTLPTYSKNYFWEAEIGWQACIYNMFIVFYLLLSIYHSKNIFSTIKMDVYGQLTVSTFI